MAESRSTRARGWASIGLAAVGLALSVGGAVAAIYVRAASAAAVEPVSHRVTTLEAQRDDDRERLRRIETKIDRLLERTP